jgi:hypothetical protein
MGAPASPSGSRAGASSPSVSTAGGFDPSRIAALAKELTELRDFLKGNWDSLAKDEAESSWMGGWGFEERLNASMWLGKQTTIALYQALDKIASAIEARRAETQSGSVHESAPEGDAQT